MLLGTLVISHLLPGKPPNQVELVCGEGSRKSEGRLGGRMGKGVSVGRSEGGLYSSADSQGRIIMKVSQESLSPFTLKLQE